MTQGERKPTTPEELWAMTKFRLLALGDDAKIEEAIIKLVENWRQKFGPEEAEDFRVKLYALVREGLVEDREAYYERRKH
jgi:hypothetical protein